jgi:Ca2+-binding EF-hand superfamily protein
MLYYYCYLSIFRAFDRYDVNRDGFISIEDLRVAFKLQGREFSERDLEDWVHARSPDGTGNVSFAHFQRHYSNAKR